MADETPQAQPAEKMLAIPLSLAQALANYVRQSSPGGSVDEAIQLLAALSALKPLPAPSVKPSKPISAPKPITRAKKKATRKARRS